METFIKKAEELASFFYEKAWLLIPHNYISSQQSQFLKYAKENLGEHEFVVLLDFSENYSFVIQDEVQGWNWANLQCTIHPFVIYYKDGNNSVSHVSLIMISECLSHNFAAVNLFLEKLITFLKKKFTTIKKIMFFSDGAPSQYKNRMNFYNLCQIHKLYGCKAEWHFFATSHGKGPCDGIGGTFKRLAAKASLQRLLNNHITTTKQLYEWARSGQSSMYYEYCTNSEHKKSARKTEKYKNVKTIAGTHQFHAFIPIDENRINCKVTSFSNEEKEVKLM